MAKAKLKVVDDDDLPAQPEGRDEELSTKEHIEEQLDEIYSAIEAGFTDQAERSDDLMDYWDLYNCKLNSNQFYDGTSQIYLPIVYNAVNARKTRFTNQIFPQSGRYVEVTTENQDIPHREIALAEHYVRKAKLRTQIMPALIKNGDIEGQYTIYVTWEERKRHVAYRRSEEIGGEKIGDIAEETISDGAPSVEVIADNDLLVLPATSDSLQAALDAGGSITIIRRWSKTKIKKMIESKAIRKDVGEAMLEEMNKDDASKRDKPKLMVDAAGIHKDGRGKFAQVYETWAMLEIDEEDDDRRLCRMYFGGPEKYLSAKRNPYWCDRLPIFSGPAEKIQGAFKGVAKVSTVDRVQYQANDAVNEGMDSAAYALAPIIMTDPDKNPKIGSMILAVGAVWETSPADTQFAQFPPLWKDAFEIVQAARAEIFQTLNVNPAMTTQATSRKRPTQAEISAEQQVDILTTADAVTVVEEEILTPMVSFFLELDHQFRDKPLLVREYGPMGQKANMQMIEPVQMERAYQFRWFGVEAARNAQQVQQQIAAINVVRGIPPQMYKGYTIDLGPVISQLMEVTFGPRLAPLTFKDAREELSVDPQEENEMALAGFTVPVHILDNHQEHMQAHMMAMQMGDPHGTLKVHIMAHLQALQAAQQQNQGIPGAPGGAGKGLPGQPRAGAQPGASRGAQNPPGAIHEDRMQDPGVMPSP